MTTFFLIVLASVLVSSVSLVGSTFLVWKRFFEEKQIPSLVSFAAGVMLTAAFFDLLPEAMEIRSDGNLFVPMFLGIISFFLLERFVLWFHHHHDGHGKKPSALLVLVGDSFHNILDGVTIAAAFLVSPALGVTTTLAICAHEIPQEIADFSILIDGGFTKAKALLYNFISGIAALVGALFGYYFLESFSHVEWILLSFSAGMFVYIACSDLIPELHQDFKVQRKWSQTLPFLFGIGLLFCMIKILEG